MKNDVLYRGFDNIPSRKGRGGVYSYIRWQDVSDRMNEVFGTDWSSEAVDQIVTGDKVIIRVKVTIFNKELNTSFSQEGFGGAINDEKSDAGNPFKSAYSKALKDACKKWGVGLYLDEDGESSSSGPESLPPGFTGKEYGVPPVKQTSVASPMTPPPGVMMPTPGLTAVIEASPVEEEPVEFVPEAPPTLPKSVPTPAPSVPSVPPTAPKAVEQPKAPKAPSVPKAPPAPKVPLQPVAQSVPSVPPSTPAQKPMQVPPSVNLSAGEKPLGSSKLAINTGEPEYISDVQKAALHSILSIKGVEYEALAAEAFEANGVVKNPIPAPDDLTYQEAVYVVKFGNDKFRRR